MSSVIAATMWTQFISGGVLVGLIGLLLAYTRMKPGERERLAMAQDEAGVNTESRRLDLARSRITLVDNYEDQLANMAAALATVRSELGTLQTQFEEVKRSWTSAEASLKAVTAERDFVVAQNQDLRATNAALSSEVRALERRVSQLEGGAS